MQRRPRDLRRVPQARRETDVAELIHHERAQGRCLVEFVVVAHLEPQPGFRVFLAVEELPDDPHRHLRVRPAQRFFQGVQRRLLVGIVRVAQDGQRLRNGHAQLRSLFPRCVGGGLLARGGRDAYPRGDRPNLHRPRRGLLRVGEVAQHPPDGEHDRETAREEKKAEPAESTRRLERSHTRGVGQKNLPPDARPRKEGNNRRYANSQPGGKSGYAASPDHPYWNFTTRDDFLAGVAVFE